MTEEDARPHIVRLTTDSHRVYQTPNLLVGDQTVRLTFDAHAVDHGLERDLGRKRLVPRDLLEAAGAFLGSKGWPESRWAGLVKRAHLLAGIELTGDLVWESIPAKVWPHMLDLVETLTDCPTKVLALTPALARQLASEGFEVVDPERKDARPGEAPKPSEPPPPAPGFGVAETQEPAAPAEES